MTHLAAFLRQPFCRALAAALLHFLWQGTLVALFLAAANVALQRATARARYAAACGALAVMLVLPAATLWRIASHGGADAVPLPAVLLDEGRASDALPIAAPLVRSAAVAAIPPGPLAAAEPWILLAWLTGVCALSVRFLGGFTAAEQLKHRRTSPVAPAWERRFEELSRRLRVWRPVRLLESALVRVPTAVGILRPVVLVPAGILTGLRAEQLDSLLAHELAHIARRDCLASLGQALAETLLFYHPAVWWVSHRIRVEREHACDDLAVAATGDPAAYARALLELEERRALVPRLAMAADGAGLWDRVTRLFPAPDSETSRSPRWLAAAMALGAMLALGAVAQVPELDPPAAPRAEPTMRAASYAPPRGKDCQGRLRLAASGSEMIRVSLLPSVPPRDGQTGAAGQTAPAAPAKGIPAPSLLTPQQLIAFRIHGVTPEFIGEIRALGYEKASPDDLIALRVHGVTPAFISQMTEIFGKLSLEDCVALKIHDVSPESSRELAKTFGKVSADDAVSLQIHGVDAAFIQGFRDAGFPSLSPEDAVALAIHKATPEFARSMRSLGLEGLSPEDLVAFRIHDVTIGYVREIQSLGYARISPDELTAFRVHGITPDWIRQMNARAGRTLDAEELIQRRIHGAREVQS